MCASSSAMGHRTVRPTRVNDDALFRRGLLGNQKSRLCVHSDVKPICLLASALLVMAVGANAQYYPKDYARIAHRNGSATLSVLSNGRSLLDGLVAVREEYGWKLYLEQVPGCYEPPGGTKFQSTYPEDATFVRPRWTMNNSPRFVYSVPSSSEAPILGKIVSDYNVSNPPCRYTAIKLRDGSYVVTATSVRKTDRTYQKVTPLLDTAISIPEGAGPPEAPDVPWNYVAKAVSAASGIEVDVNFPSDTGFPAKNNPARTGLARDVLAATLSSYGWHGDWDLYCDGRLCVVNVEFPSRAVYDQFRDRKFPWDDGRGRVRSVPSGD
jgi:hypothetical protein